VCGKFNISQGIDLEEIKKSPEVAEENIIGIEELFSNSGQVSLNARKLELFLNGVMLTEIKEDGIYRVYSDDKFIGLGIVKNDLLKRDIIL